jgi:hypothetical protein
MSGYQHTLIPTIEMLPSTNRATALSNGMAARNAFVLEGGGGGGRKF